MRMQVSILKSFVFIFTITLLTLGALGHLSYSASDTPQIYWSVDWNADDDDPFTGKIQRANLNGSNVQNVTTGLVVPWGIALEVAGGKVYYGDRFYGIRRANLDGSNVQNLVSGDLVQPNDIALDVTGGKIYWTDDDTGKIQRANLNGSNIQDLVTTGLDQPQGIVLDVAGGKMYWVDWGTEKIQQANLDGSNIRDIVTSGIVSPWGITLDVVGRKIYWTDVARKKIQRANLNGSNIQDLVTTGLDFPFGIALDVASEKMYWTDLNTGKIQRANLNGSNVQDIITGLVNPCAIALSIPSQSTPPVMTDPPVTSLKISEIMVASNGGRLPQWIELHNHSNTHEINLMGWTLKIQNYRSADFNGDLNVTFTFKEKVIQPQGTLLIVSKQGRFSDNFPKEQVYNLNTLHPNFQDIVLNEEGFYMELSSKSDEQIDAVGNLNGRGNANNAVIWPLPKGVTKDGARTSMIRRYDDGVPRLGTDAGTWISAKNTKLLTGTTHYYGHSNDIGAPGVRSGGALPVTLSYFRGNHTDAGVVLKWTTESEVDNAGFYILRSEIRNGEFKVVNPIMIQGAGTTGERHTYTWTDSTAEPNTVYYYRIEDVSHAGVRKQLATVRLKGLVSASGKLTTRWANLKMQK